jgi:hypothetical protein
MISNMTASIDREVTRCQERFKASADYWLSLAAAPTFAIMALARKLLVALWRYLETGLVPAGAIFKPR